MFDELEKLSLSMSKRHQSLKGEMDSLGRRRRAAKAYARTDAPGTGNLKTGGR